MKKTFVLFMGLLACFVVCHAAPVSKSVAANQAKAFLAAKHPNQTVNLKLALQGRQRSLGHGAMENNSYYYVFNCNNGDGFVIISGDDATPEVLGYADDGAFDINNIPENMRTWLDGYSEQIEWARNNPLKAKAVNTDDVTPRQARQVIQPLVTTKWSQENPYNQKCFTANGEQAVTGCVATALAQVMYYHKWPRAATTAIPAYSDNGSYSQLPSTTFDWDNMKDCYTGNETADDPHAAAVAQLMVYCGHSVKMDYGVSGSGADTNETVNALSNYFGYENTPSCIRRGSFSSEEWENILYNELHHGRPVIYTGRTANNEGHAFICDGYDGDGLYHINWGWGGLSEGYFRLQVLNPAAQGTGGGVGSLGYTYGQTMVVGISPKQLDENVEGSDNANKVKVEALKMVDGSNSVYNYSGSAFSSVNVKYSFSVTASGTYVLGLGLYRGEELLQSQSLGSQNVTSGNTWTFSSFGLWGLGRSLQNGVYQIKCIFKENGSSQWDKNEDGDYKYIEVTIAGDTATFVEKEEYPQVEVTSVEQRDGGLRKRIRAYIKNTSEMNFDGSMLLLINDALYSKENVYVNAGDESFIDFLFNYSNTDPVHLKIACRTSSNVVYDNENFSIVSVLPQQNPEVLAYEMRNIDSNKMYGTLAEACITLRNNSETDYEGTAEMTVYKRKAPNSTSWSILSSSTDISLKAGETKDVLVHYTGLAYGDEVFFNVSCAGRSYSNGSFSSAFIVTPGYVEWDGNGVRSAHGLASNITVSSGASAVSFEGIDMASRTITPSVNPNTIYYLDGTASVPSSLSGKNVVKGTKAVGNVNFVAGYPCFVPADFDVDATVAYTHTSTSACDGRKGWQNVTLPFGVQKVKAEGEMIDWNRDETDDGKDFWLKSFVDVQNDKAHFMNAAEWVPNEPYLLGLPSSFIEKDVVMSANGTRVYKSGASAMVGSGYNFVGATGNRSLDKAFVLNDIGNAFELKTPAEIQAGQAYFVALSASNANEILYIDFGGLIGDVNGDGEISVSDIMGIVNYVLGVEQNVFILENADVNGDGDISVADVLGLVNKYLE